MQCPTLYTLIRSSLQKPYLALSLRTLAGGLGLGSAGLRLSSLDGRAPHYVRAVSESLCADDGQLGVHTEYL